jgi:hypothetical protein
MASFCDKVLCFMKRINGSYLIFETSMQHCENFQRQKLLFLLVVLHWSHGSRFIAQYVNAHVTNVG